MGARNTFVIATALMLGCVLAHGMNGPAPGGAGNGKPSVIPASQDRELLIKALKTKVKVDYANTTIEAVLKELADRVSCSLIVTTGGTGPAPRDVTPEATEAVADKLMPGFGELMRQVSLKYVPTAILSRQTAVIRGKSLIVNLPGKPKSIRECLDAVMPAIPYCIDLIGGPYVETHEAVCKAFRPKSAQRPSGVGAS